MCVCTRRALHDVLDGLGFDKDSDGMKQRRLQALDGIARHIQDAVLTLERTQAHQAHVSLLPCATGASRGLSRIINSSIKSISYRTCILLG